MSTTYYICRKQEHDRAAVIGQNVDAASQTENKHSLKKYHAGKRQHGNGLCQPL